MCPVAGPTPETLGRGEPEALWQSPCATGMLLHRTLREYVLPCPPANQPPTTFPSSQLQPMHPLPQSSWIAAAATAVRTAITTHVAEPLAAVRDELFRTFRDTRPAIVTGREFALSRESLLRMLTQFAQDKGVQPDPSGEASSGPGGEPAAAVAGGGGLGDDAAVASGMAVLMHSYEEELKRPLKNLVAGDLARALLIQVRAVGHRS